MAKTTKTAKTAQIELPAVTDALRKGMRAYVGVYGLAYDRMVSGLKTAGKNFDELAAKGERVETEMQAAYEARVKKIRAALPDVANDRIDAIESEILRLTGKAEKRATKATKKVAKTAKKTTKTASTKAKKATKTVAKTATKTAKAVKKAA